MLRALVAVSLLAGCAAERADGIDSAVASAPAVMRDSAAALTNEAESVGLELTVWPANDSVIVDTLRFQIHGHPCGATLTGRFQRVPAKDAVVEPERVVEFSLSGGATREWRVPTDERPLGVQGDELMLSYRESFLLAVKPSGSYRVLPRVELPEPSDLTCPSQRIFPESVYERCLLFRDLRSQEERRISFEAPCT